MFGGTTGRLNASRSFHLIAISAAAMLLWGCATQEAGCRQRVSGSAPGLENSSAAKSGTTLRILCDIPSEIGPDEQVYAGRIDWAHGSESFAFRLSREDVDIPLAGVVTFEEPVHVYLFVDRKPPGSKKFHEGEWSAWVRYPWARSVACYDRLCVRLSGFRDAQEWAWSFRP